MNPNVIIIIIYNIALEHIVNKLGPFAACDVHMMTIEKLWKDF